MTAISTAQSPTGEFTRRPLRAAQCKMPPTIDGDLSDECWKLASRADTFVDRVTGAVASDQTIAYITYDAKNIYVAFDCRDSQPDQVMARETIRDSKYSGLQNMESPNKEDNVTFSIDPNFTQKSSDTSTFSTNALGTPSANIAGGRGNKIEWKGQWISAAKRTATGYTVEMQIPWEMLNYPSTQAPVTIGINFFRYQNRNKTETLWSNVTTHSFTDLQGRWKEVQVPHAAFKPKLSLLPYILGGASDSRIGTKEGIDARLTVTPNLTAVSTINPDFGTVEGAVESIAFSRVERALPDKRPFFLEGQSYFTSGTRFNDIGAFFYTNRVGSFDVGTKLYGKVNPTDSIGFLNTATFGGRSDTVLRYKHDLSPTDDVGFCFGQKLDAGDHNNVAVIDQHARFGPFGVESQFAKTWGDAPGGGAAVLSTNYQKANNTSVIQYHSVSDNFQPSDGYIPYHGYHGPFGFTDFSGTWKSGHYASYDMGWVGGDWYQANGSRYLRTMSTFGSVVTKDDVQYTIEHDYNDMGGTIDNQIGVSTTFGNSNRFRKFGLGANTGLSASKPSTFLQPAASVRIFKKLDLSYKGSLLNLQGTTQQHILTAGLDLTPTTSFGGRLVSQDSNTNWYVFFRNSGGKGTNTYFIIGDPNAARFQKILQVKMVFAI